MPLKKHKTSHSRKMLISKCLFPGLGSRRMWPGWMAQEQGQRESVVSTKRLGMAAPTLDLAETWRQNPFSIWEKVQCLKGQWLFWALTMYIICHNLHHLFRTFYIICRAQWKMKMWALFFKNDFQRTSLVKNPLCKAGDVGSIPGPGTKILHAAEQPSSCPTREKPVLCNERSPHVLQLRPNIAKLINLKNKKNFKSPEALLSTGLEVPFTINH